MKPLAGLVVPREADDLRAGAERRDVVRRIAGAAGHNLRRVVLKNQHRRLARHARHAAVDELVGDEIADDRNAARGECIEQLSSRASRSLSPVRMNRFMAYINKGSDPLLRIRNIQLVASISVPATGTGGIFAGRRDASVLPYPVSTSMRLRACGQPHLDVTPAIADDERLRHVERMIPRGRQYHTGLRFAAFAIGAVTLDRRVRRMRTVVVTLDLRAGGLEQLATDARAPRRETLRSALRSRRRSGSSRRRPCNPRD